MDKSKLYGYDLPNGTWFVKMKIENDELWKRLKQENLKGFQLKVTLLTRWKRCQKKHQQMKKYLSFK
jgi:hypothetical protein